MPGPLLARQRAPRFRHVGRIPFRVPQPALADGRGRYGQALIGNSCIRRNRHFVERARRRCSAGKAIWWLPTGSACPGASRRACSENRRRWPASERSRAGQTSVSRAPGVSGDLRAGTLAEPSWAQQAHHRAERRLTAASVRPALTAPVCVSHLCRPSSDRDPTVLCMIPCAATPCIGQKSQLGRADDLLREQP